MRRELEDRADWLSRHVLPHEAALRAWLRRRPVPGLDIDDIVQETYARLAALQTLEAVRDGRGYMFQTALSIVTNHVRRARIVSIRAVSALEELGAAAPEPSPERQVEDRDELQRLADCIAALPSRPREVILLRRVEGLSQRATADRLGLSEKAVEKHMSRALRLLLDAFGRSGRRVPPEGAERVDRQSHETKDAEPISR